jgi:hypothetical protein
MMINKNKKHFSYLDLAEIPIRFAKVTYMIIDLLVISFCFTRRKPYFFQLHFQLGFQVLNVMRTKL